MAYVFGNTIRNYAVTSYLEQKKPDQYAARDKTKNFQVWAADNFPPIKNGGALLFEGDKRGRQYMLPVIKHLDEMKLFAINNLLDGKTVLENHEFLRNFNCLKVCLLPRDYMAQRKHAVAFTWNGVYELTVLWRNFCLEILFGLQEHPKIAAVIEVDGPVAKRQKLTATTSEA